MKKQVIAPMSVRAGGAGGCHRPAPPPFPSQILGNLDFLGQQEKFWQNQFLQKFPCFVSSFFFFESDIFLFEAIYSYIHFVCRPMLVYRKTLVPLRLFHKHLGNLQDFRQVVHFRSLPPSSGKKWPVPAPMIALVSLTRY